MKKTIFLTAAFGLLASSANAAILEGWDTSNVTIAAGPYLPYTTYSSVITNADGVSNGKVNWKEGNVKGPGLQVNETVATTYTKKGVARTTEVKCLMTTGYNELYYVADDPSTWIEKECTDDLKTSKRAKVMNTVTAPLELDFNVVYGPTNTYKMEQKLTNGTPADLWESYTIELGTRDADGNFVASTVGDGLGFSTDTGAIFTSTVSTDNVLPLILSANFAQGLSGPADYYHPEPGYFNPEERMGFSMTADEDIITSTGVSTTYSNVFGSWLNSAGAPIAIFHDDDNDINSDNVLMGNCAEGPADNFVHVGTHTGDDVNGLVCNGTWVNWRGVAVGGDPDQLGDVAADGLNGQTVYPSVTAAIAAIAAGEQNVMYMDYVEDAANLGLTFWITVDESFAEDKMVIRYSPVAAQ
ncbi:MAG: choice-of-anchor F family protein [Proteobacteria bacterium]|nr:choice-of-anchor F family protein [Pseudomonadota bacterium]MBU1234205.1 choice-of-anchor F family protein [Pseudomonadota bacterium]